MSAGRTMNFNWTLTSSRWVNGAAPTRFKIVAQLDLDLNTLGHESDDAKM